MERRWLALSICLGCCVLFFAVGCQKHAGPVEKPQPQTPIALALALVPAKTSQTTGQASAQPRLTFEKVLYDFGKIPPSTVVTCEFKFKNTGKALLKIEDIHATCGCTVPEISRKEYEPGQSGIITVKYHSPNRPRLETKHIYVQSNDPVNPKMGLTIKAQIVNKVSVEPEKLNLSLREKNVGCPDITLTSTDGNSFSIKKIESTGDCMIIDFNSTVQATQYVLHPKVDVEKLRQNFNLEGRLTIDISHPQCPSLTVPFTAVSEFRIEPSVVTILKAEPNRPVSKRLAIRNNYNEPFEIESVMSRMGYTKVARQTRDPNDGYMLDLQITPPPPKNRSRMFSDVLTVKIKKGESFKINCRGFYVAEQAKPVIADVNRTGK